MAFYCKQLLNGGLDLLKWIKGQSFKRQALNSHAHLCYWKETLTCWAVALAGTGWLDTLFQARKKLPVADTFNIWKVERQNSLMCRVQSQRVWLGTEHSSSTCCFHFISFRFLNIHDVETSGKQCHQQMKLFFGMTWMRDFLLICVAFPIVHNVKEPRHTTLSRGCDVKAATAHLIFGPSLQMLPRMRGLRGRSQHMARGLIPCLLRSQKMSSTEHIMLLSWDGTHESLTLLYFSQWVFMSMSLLN